MPEKAILISIFFVSFFPQIPQIVAFFAFLLTFLRVYVCEIADCIYAS